MRTIINEVKVKKDESIDKAIRRFKKLGNGIPGRGMSRGRHFENFPAGPPGRGWEKRAIPRKENRRRTRGKAKERQKGQIP